ncbi:MAG: DUF1150 family protein [Kiloniellales bacterium]
MNNAPQKLSQISAQDFLALGMNDMAYVKPVVIDQQPLFAVHAADGRQIAVMPSREVAFATVRHNDLEPLYVH